MTGSLCRTYDEACLRYPREIIFRRYVDWWERALAEEKFVHICERYGTSDGVEIAEIACENLWQRERANQGR